MEKEKNDYYVLFRGVRLSKRDANRVGLSIIFGVVGIFISIYLTDYKALRILFTSLLAGFGYFIIGPILYK